MTPRIRIPEWPHSRPDLNKQYYIRLVIDEQRESAAGEILFEGVQRNDPVHLSKIDTHMYFGMIVTVLIGCLTELEHEKTTIDADKGPHQNEEASVDVKILMDGS